MLKYSGRGVGGWGGLKLGFKQSSSFVTSGSLAADHSKTFFMVQHSCIN